MKRTELFERGKQFGLQWGRGLGAAECCCVASCRHGGPSFLQWGRGLGAAE